MITTEAPSWMCELWTDGTVVDVRELVAVTEVIHRKGNQEMPYRLDLRLQSGHDLSINFASMESAARTRAKLLSAWAATKKRTARTARTVRSRKEASHDHA